MSFRIKEVDGLDDDVSDTIQELHKLTFLESAPTVVPDHGFWWLVYDRKEAVGFAGLVPSSMGFGIGYLKRSGVIHTHRGHGLQRRLLRVREAKAKREGWSTLITDTTDNIHSANNLISAGFKLFRPEAPWGYQTSLYWRKDLTRAVH